MTNETFKNLYGNFGECGLETVHEFALDILPHMRKDILGRVTIARWTDRGLPVVETTFKSLLGLCEWACDNFGYGFQICWNGR